MAWGASHQAAPPEQQSVLRTSFVPVGSRVQFKTALGGTIVANVICFDSALNVLAVKEETKGKPSIRIFNLSLISDMEELVPATPESEADCLYSGQNTTQQSMDRRNLALAKRKSEAMPEEVSIEGQRAFVQLRKTIDKCRWDGKNIVVLDRVVVPSPYTSEAAYQKDKDSKQDEAALNHVQKILSKPFVVDLKLVPCCKSNYVS